MIELDFRVRRESDLADVVWSEANDTLLRYNCMLGDIRFVVNGVDLSIEWGWIPIFDFALSMGWISEGLRVHDAETFDFTDSDYVIEFRVESGRVRIEPGYTDAAAVVDLGEFHRAAADLLSRVCRCLEDRHPEIARNPHYRRVLEEHRHEGSGR